MFYPTGSEKVKRIFITVKGLQIIEIGFIFYGTSNIKKGEILCGPYFPSPIWVLC
jgi:hypothetical protein